MPVVNFIVSKQSNGLHEAILKISDIDIHSGTQSSTGKSETIVSVMPKKLVVDGVELLPRTFSICTPMRATARDRNAAKLAALKAQMEKILAAQATAAQATPAVGPALSKAEQDAKDLAEYRAMLAAKAK